MSYPALSIRLNNNQDVHLNEAKEAIEQAKFLIEKIGTTGVERTDVIGKAEGWLKCYDKGKFPVKIY